MVGQSGHLCSSLKAPYLHELTNGWVPSDGVGDPSQHGALKRSVLFYPLDLYIKSLPILSLSQDTPLQTLQVSNANLNNPVICFIPTHMRYVLPKIVIYAPIIRI